MQVFVEVLQMFAAASVQFELLTHWTQAFVALHAGAEAGQSLELRHCTQAAVSMLQMGVAPVHGPEAPQLAAVASTMASASMSPGRMQAPALHVPPMAVQSTHGLPATPQNEFAWPGSQVTLLQHPPQLPGPHTGVPASSAGASSTQKPLLQNMSPTQLVLTTHCWQIPVAVLQKGVELEPAQSESTVQRPTLASGEPNVTQVPLEQARPAAQTIPHWPQLVWSVVRSEQTLP